MRLIMPLLVIGVVAAGRASAWAADTFAADAIEAVDKDRLGSFAIRSEGEITPLLTDVRKVDSDALALAAGAREFGRYFDGVGKLDGGEREALRFLAGKRRLRTTLMLAASAADSPRGVLAVLAALLADQKGSPEVLEEYADLVAALCVVWDAPPIGPGGQPMDVKRAARLFRFLTANRVRLRMDPKSLPWELAVYVARNEGGDGELYWALERYGRGAGLGRAFFDPPYDPGAEYASAADAAVDTPAYTLPNIVRFGGGCPALAEYAARVARSCGAPAAVCVPTESWGGEPQAWAAYFKAAGKGVVWDWEGGRFAEHRGWAGQVNDPQTGAWVTDGELAITAELAVTPSKDRLASQALCKVSDVVAPEKALEVYEKAVELSPGNVRAWAALAELAASGNLTAAEFARVTQRLEKFAGQRYERFLLLTWRRLVAQRPPKDQAAALEKLAKRFEKRPALAAEVRLAIADVLAGDKPAEALATLGAVLRDPVASGGATVGAVRRVDAMLRSSGELGRLAAIYRDVWPKLPRPRQLPHAGTTPFYVVGTGYAAALRDAGDISASEVVQQQLDVVLEGGSTGRRQR